jgi:hypothetical protein
MFGGIFESLFAPGRKHLDDERNRLEVTKDEAGDSAPGKGPIDLASGRVVMRGREESAGKMPEKTAVLAGDGTGEGTAGDTGGSG